jgi:hypothetical protein
LSVETKAIGIALIKQIFETSSAISGYSVQSVLCETQSLFSGVFKMGDPGPNLMDGFALPPSQNDNIIPPPIAIVGIGLRLPGGIHSTEALWDLLINKRTTRGVVPSSRYNIESFWSSTKKAGFVNSQHGHFLAEEDNFEHFDASLFSLSKSEVEQLDPQQRMLLEVIWECMQNGGQKDWRGKDIGVYVGTWSDVS